MVDLPQSRKTVRVRFPMTHLKISKSKNSKNAPRALAEMLRASANHWTPTGKSETETPAYVHRLSETSKIYAASGSGHKEHGLQSMRQLFSVAGFSKAKLKSATLHLPCGILEQRT